MYVLLFLIVSVLASSVVVRKFDLRSAPTNDYKTGTCCFSCRHLTHIITSHRITTCSRTDITVKNCSFGGKQQAFTHLVVNNRHSLIWWQTTGIHSFGGKQQAFTHLVVNNRHSLIWW